MLWWLAVAVLVVGARAYTDVELEVVSQGYIGETHNVTTSDGYVLQIHRVRQNATGAGGQVVFLMHGLALASNSFIYSGKKSAIAYNLADAGFDVWMGNARGNNYSHSHLFLVAEHDDLEFFNFGYEEIGLYDLSAMVDYTLAVTKRDKLHYVGHSLGGTVFYVLNAMNATYQSKFASAHLLAGLGYQTNFPNSQIVYLCKATDVIYNSLLKVGDVEMKPTDFTATFLKIFMNAGKVPYDLDGGASVKEVTQFCQNIRDKSFARWNYGEAGNLQKYGSKTPPSYDLSSITVNVTLHYSAGDMTQSETDVLAMAQALPNAKTRKISRSSFDNLDYITSNDLKSLVTAYIINSIKNS